MERLTENKIILVSRRTRLDDLIRRFNTQAQARFYVEHLGADFSDYVKEHEQYIESVGQCESALRSLGRLQVVDRSFLPNFIFAEGDTVVVIGQDGLVANTVKYLNGQKVIGVNPDPERWDGILLPFTPGDLRKIVPEAFAGRRPVKEVTMAKAELNDKQVLYAVNDLFIGVKSHVSARYVLRTGDDEERQSSSGIIVSTGLGSTGWFKSLMEGAVSVATAATGAEIPAERPTSFPWDADHLYFTVREPFASRTSATKLVFGKITSDSPLIVISQTAESGVIFSDGIEADFLLFNSGTKATISVAEKRGYLVV